MEGVIAPKGKNSFRLSFKNILKFFQNLKFSELASMKPEDMASNELKKLREKFTKEAINDHQMAQNEGMLFEFVLNNY